MPAPLRDSPNGDLGLLRNPYYGSMLPDFRLLRGNYYTMLNSTALKINDSQVSYPLTRFWPAMFQKLNPNQPKVNSYFVGMMGTHHWGMAWSEAIEQTPPAVNPFPKTILLESLATFALNHLDDPDPK
jgi:hypothetical protein